jgi:phosphatidylethanolamine N-methyltransferase
MEKIILHLSSFTQHIDTEEKCFRFTIYFSLLSAFLGSFIPHLQYKYKIISKITNDDFGKAADVLAYILIHIGTFRNYSFIEACYFNKQLELGDAFKVFCISFGWVFIILGLVLVLTSFHKLGLRGMYFGDHFGFLFENKISSFPYNYFENPQYIGSILIYLGISFAYRSLTGILLTVIICFFNQFVFRFFEKKKLKVFYPKKEKAN